VHFRLLCVRTSPLDVSTVSKCAIEAEQGRYRGNVCIITEKTDKIFCSIFCCVGTLYPLVIFFSQCSSLVIVSENMINTKLIPDLVPQTFPLIINVKATANKLLL